MKHLIETAQALEWAKQDGKASIAAVVKTWGSSPRPAGSLLVIRSDGLFEGSVSGGCVEGAVVEEAFRIVETGKPKLLEYGVPSGKAWETGLSCGGHIAILVSPLGPAQIPALEEIEAARAAKTEALMATRFSDGALAAFQDGRWTGDGGFAQDLAKHLADPLAVTDPEVIEAGGDKIFLNPVKPPPRMFVFGAVHIAQALIPMAELAGFDVTLIDPRGAFAESGRFPDAAVSEDWPDEFLAKAGLKRSDAVVTLTHDPKLDEAALKIALESDVFYIGSLGSRKTHSARLKRLKRDGFSDADLKRIHGPVGLAIGAKTPAEIAVSILAEVIEKRRLP